MTSTATVPLTRALDALAVLFLYPNAGTCDAAAGLQSDVAGECPEAAELLGPLVEQLGSSGLSDSEERYVRTFELNPTCALEVGWQRFGEQYARGAFLVRMRDLTRQAGLVESTELPDHLPNVLRVITRIDEETAAKLATRFTLPALASMREKFGEATGATGRNPYVGLLEATSLVLERRFPVADRAEVAEVNNE
jgi:nitrate reductase molybdenum cofactor assembly chaperone